jgi:hypothetical protein
VGDFERRFKAVDARIGEVVRHIRLGNTVQDRRKLQLDGKQYIDVTSRLADGGPNRRQPRCWTKRTESRRAT